MKEVSGLTSLELYIEAVPSFPPILGEMLAYVPNLQTLNVHLNWLQLGEVIVLVQQPQMPMENWRNKYYAAVAPGLAHLTKLRELHLHTENDIVRSKEKSFFDTGAAFVQPIARYCPKQLMYSPRHLKRDTHSALC